MLASRLHWVLSSGQWLIFSSLKMLLFPAAMRHYLQTNWSVCGGVGGWKGLRLLMQQKLQRTIGQIMGFSVSAFLGLLKMEALHTTVNEPRGPYLTWTQLPSFQGAYLVHALHTQKHKGFPTVWQCPLGLLGADMSPSETPLQRAPAAEGTQHH